MEEGEIFLYVFLPLPFQAEEKLELRLCFKGQNIHMAISLRNTNRWIQESWIGT